MVADSIYHDGRYIGLVKRVPGFNGLRFEAKQYGQIEGERFATRQAAIAWLTSLPSAPIDDDEDDEPMGLVTTRRFVGDERGTLHTTFGKVVG